MLFIFFNKWYIWYTYNGTFKDKVTAKKNALLVFVQVLIVLS